ncbi:MAG: MBL fold metallo-hydrolase [Actinomycetota bacterium]
MSLADVTGVANCHLHFDHGGQNVRIPTGVPIFVQRAEWAMVNEPDYTVPEWIDAPGLTYEVLDGEMEVAPGLRLIPTPGHTTGHQSLVLDAADGTVVLAGQAVQSRAEWEGATEPSASGVSTAPDPGYPSSVERLRSFDPVRVHFAHDPAVWER